MSYWFRNENRLPQGRLSAVSYISAGMIGLLLLGFWKLQVIDSDKYILMAERNRERNIAIIAPRGRMLDRDGRVLVDNYPSFSVLLLRDDPAAVAKALPNIARGLNVSLEDLREQMNTSKGLPRFQPIVIKPDASKADIAVIEAHRQEVPVLELLMMYRRRYQPGGFMAHASGYVGEVSEKQIEQSDNKLRAGDVVGKTGLERQYNERLMGTDGQRRVIVNNLGKEVSRLSQQDPVSGKDINLTIDYDLQLAAEQALQDRKGSVVALDPRTGEVLAMVSHPAPDPNDFATRVPKEIWQALNENPDHPLLNRAIQAQLAPGSVFKIAMATAMLESKAIPASFTAYCPGYGTFYGRMFKCHVYGKGGHGLVDFHKAIVQSCDVFFYNVGMRLGIDKISYYASKLGLGRRTGVDLPSEEPGLVPSEEWTERVFHRKWYLGETISVSIGQGAMTSTPMQLARMIGGVAMGGIFKQPHLLKDAPNLTEERFPLAEDTVEKVTQGMYGVVNEGGTAAGSKLEGIEFSGKSGSAQVIGYDTRDKYNKRKEFKDNAWFVGYAPRRNPEIVVSVLVEEGEHGGAVGGPIARDVVKAYYEKKARKSEEILKAGAVPQGPGGEKTAPQAAAGPVSKTEEKAATAAGAQH
ncbi:MAG: penicillin-binding protein 2 [Acidobacteriia bacterium]|nr:penicillin-binding protein 2 [Terriglobia bacterium]